MYRAFYPIKLKEGIEYKGIIISLIACVLLYLFVEMIDEKYLHFFLESNCKDPTFKFVFALALSGIFAGWISSLYTSIRYRWGGRVSFIKKPDMQSVWAKTLLSLKEDWVFVFLDDGSTYRGWMSDFIYDPDSDNQDFLLNPAYKIDAHYNIEYEIDGIGGYLNTKNVKRIEFFRPTPKKNKNRKQKSRLRDAISLCKEFISKLAKCLFS